MYRNLGSVICMSALAALIGCTGGAGEQPKTVKAGGSVTLDNQPVEGATVMFSPKQKDGRAAVGKTDGAGNFKLITTGSAEGAVPGSYNVAITKEVTEGKVLTQEERNAEMQKTGKLPPSPKSVNQLPEKYRDPVKSGLAATVTEKGPNEFKFELTK